MLFTEMAKALLDKAESVGQFPTIADSNYGSLELLLTDPSEFEEATVGLLVYREFVIRKTLNASYPWEKVVVKDALWDGNKVTMVIHLFYQKETAPCPLNHLLNPFSTS